VLSELPRYLAATNMPTLCEADSMQLCAALTAALQASGPLPPQLLASPGPKTLYGQLEKTQGTLSAAQQLQVLECLAAMAQAGCGK
jgi:hypothetical protein